jgi:hypothetical protein
VTDGYVVADFDCRLLVKGVKHRAVLDVNAVADADGVYIATDNGVKPDAALVTDYCVADDCSVFGKEATFTDLRSETANRDY